MSHKIKGFTLIELLVVVAIIGALAAVGVVAYTGYTSAAKKNVTKQNHVLMVKQFTIMVLDFSVYGSIDRKLNGGKIANYTQKNLAFDCPAFQHHFNQLRLVFIRYPSGYDE